MQAKLIGSCTEVDYGSMIVPSCASSLPVHMAEVHVKYALLLHGSVDLRWLKEIVLSIPWTTEAASGGQVMIDGKRQNEAESRQLEAF